MLKPKFKTAVLAEIRKAKTSGQSEAVAIADWLEGIYEEEDMDAELILSALYEVESWASVIRQNLAGRNKRGGIHPLLSSSVKE